MSENFPRESQTVTSNFVPTKVTLENGSYGYRAIITTEY